MLLWIQNFHNPFIQVWQLFNSPIDPYPNTSELIGFCVQHYLQPLGESVVTNY